MAQFNLGLMYYHGQGVAQDFKAALVWNRKAADQGHADAQFNLGAMYANGQGVLQSIPTALIWVHKAAAQGGASALEALPQLKSMSADADAPAASPESPPVKPAASSPLCASCSAESGPGGAALKPCSRCKAVSYCGKECQRAHWKAGHKAACNSSTGPGK